MEACFQSSLVHVWSMGMFPGCLDQSINARASPSRTTCTAPAPAPGPHCTIHYSPSPHTVHTSVIELWAYGTCTCYQPTTTNSSPLSQAIEAPPVQSNLPFLLHPHSSNPPRRATTFLKPYIFCIIATFFDLTTPYRIHSLRPLLLLSPYRPSWRVEWCCTSSLS